MKPFERKAILTEKQVLKIRKLHKTGTSIGRLKDEYNVSRMCIHQVVTRKTWRHLK